MVILAEIAVTAYAINDFMKKEIDLLEHDTVKFLTKLREVYKKSKIVSILPLWTVWNGDDVNFKSEERECLKRIYAQYSDYTIDGHLLIPHNKKYFADDVHPNDEGFAFYGINLSKELTNIIKEL